MSVRLEVFGVQPFRAPVRLPPGVPAHILVVDDDKDIRQISAAALTRSGYQVDAAEDGAAAWKALQADNYDLLITDHNMPKLTGVELVEQMRAAHMELPVILVTGASPVKEMARNPRLRLAAILLKPFWADQLLETVREVLHEGSGASVEQRFQTTES